MKRMVSYVLIVALLVAVFPVVSVHATDATSWDWPSENVTEGWTHNNQIDDWAVVDGCYVVHIPGSADPFVTSPVISINSQTYKTLEITCANQTGNANAKLYWRNSGEGFSEAKSLNFMTHTDGQFHTYQINLAQRVNWTGTVVEIRLDPTTGGTGNFAIDSLHFLQTKKSEAAVTQEWQFRTDANAEGWTPNDQIASAGVENGRYVLNLNAYVDPNITSPAVLVNTEQYKTFEITYKNNTGNTDAKLYWARSGEGFSELSAKSFTTEADGKWHTMRVDLSSLVSWNGVVTQLRFDPTTGGTGSFEIDRIAMLDGCSRYTISNGYYYLSGVNGLIDTMCIDPAGTGNYREDLISGNMFLALEAESVPYSGTYSDVDWNITGNTLQIRNIQFHTSGLSGVWTIELNGSQLNHAFSITSCYDNMELKNVGFVMDMLWENNGYAVEASPAGSLKVPFTKMVSSSDRYHSAYAFKRMSGEDIDTLGLDGEWIDWEGANGFDFNLRFTPDTEYISPECMVDNLRLHFREPDAETITINNGGTFIRTLTMNVSASGDITPDHYARYEGGDPEITEALNDMMYEFGYAREAASTQPDWWEWISLTRAWQEDNYLQPDLEKLNIVGQNENGYIWTWNELQGWPFPTDRDSNHYLMTTANFINAVYNYFMYNGDLEFLETNIAKMRLGMNYLLSQYDEDSQLFVISHPDHDGTNNGIGSNYWDITPYGYKSAYDNIYCYLALTRMSEIEQMLGNTARAAELTNYANDLKTGYNAAFWDDDHYIQVIDVNGDTHDYGCVYLNLEAINYGLADDAKALAIMNFMSNTPTGSGVADTFTAFQFAPRVTMFNNVHNSLGGWYVAIYNSDGIFGTSQLQNGGANFYTSYYELLCRIKTYGADNAYDRLGTIVDRFRVDHLQGGNPLYYGEKNQHGGEGNVGLWGEFPESGLVPVAVKDGFMGISADMNGLHVTPNLPSSGMTSMSLDAVDYWGMKLKITASNSSVTIQALENNSTYTDWNINGTAVSGLFSMTIPITEGGTVTLARTNNTYDLNNI